MKKLISVSLLSAAFSMSAGAFAQTAETPNVSEPNAEAANSAVSANEKYVVSPQAVAKALTESVKKHECNIPFENGDEDFNRDLLTACVAAVQKQDMKFISVTAGASPVGSLRSNKKLSEQRAETLRAELTRLFPGTQIEARGVGVQASTGRTAHLVFVTAPTAETAAADIVKMSSPLSAEMPVPQTAPVEVAVNPPVESPDLNKVNLDSSAKLGADRTDRQNWLRVAVRGANDRYQEDNKYYGSAGADLSYVRLQTFVPSIRGEVGATGSMMFDDQYKNSFRGYNAHAFVGPAFAVKGFVIGGRALGGGVWDEQRKFRVDGGGEGRLGYEAGNGISIFAGAGRTQKLTRYGMDLGMVF